MNTASILLLVLLAAVVGVAVWRTTHRARHGSACCGEREADVRRIRVADRDKSHYPYTAEIEITSMTCANCAARVENALNSLDGIWAAVKIDTHKAVIRAKSPIDETRIRNAVHQAGYGLGKVTL